MPVCKMAESASSASAPASSLDEQEANGSSESTATLLTFYLERVCLTTRIIGTFLGIIGMFLSIIGRFWGNWGIA